jgi:hypothetical protein
MTLGDILGLPSSGKVHALYSDEPEEDKRMIQMMKDNYAQDPLTRMVLANPGDHKRFFSTADGLIQTKNYQGQDVSACHEKTISLPDYCQRPTRSWAIIETKGLASISVDGTGGPRCRSRHTGFAKPVRPANNRRIPRNGRQANYTHCCCP